VPRLGEQFAGTQARDHRHSARAAATIQSRGSSPRNQREEDGETVRANHAGKAAGAESVATGRALGPGRSDRAARSPPTSSTRSEVETRRHMAIDRGGAAFRRAGKRLDRGVHVKIAFASGHAHRLVHGLRRAPVPELDDATLAHKVESVLFRDARVPKGRISVNARTRRRLSPRRGGKPDLIEELERAARRIGGVRSVENLLHQPGTLAPHVERRRAAPPRGDGRAW